MAMTDPLGDMVTRIRNAVRRGHATVQMPASTLKAEVARVLCQEGFLQGVERLEEGGHPVLRLRLRYQDGETPMITGIRRVSRPGKRVYVRRPHIPHVRGGMGVAILTTPHGIMTGTESRVQKVGGEVLCYIW
ncbi:MAG: 30S ribosomal protein S8 [Nitrospirae bacterium]|nr:MAG: 30S ribosomal protein S8 [Nitrospirota bacterium]